MVRPENKLKVITKSLFDKVGADKAIQNVLMGKIWNLGATPLTLLFVIWYLSPKEQGYYFTFASLQALQVFFELGLTGVIMQFASHEMAKLEWTKENILAGDERKMPRCTVVYVFVLMLKCQHSRSEAAMANTSSSFAYCYVVCCCNYC